jgi:hypothetical protein
MPIVIILSDNLYDIVISTDKPDKLYKLYNFAISLNPTDEKCAPMNAEILKTTGELWVTSRSVMYNDEADFRSKFPDRRTPMRLDIRHAEKTKWYHGIVDLGIRYFCTKALSEDVDMAPMSQFPASILTRPRKATPEQLLEHYMWLTDLRLKNSQ